MPGVALARTVSRPHERAPLRAAGWPLTVPAGQHPGRLRRRLAIIHARAKQQPMTQTLHDTPSRRLAVHLRDGDMLRAVLPHTSRHFARAIIMPNCARPVVTARRCTAYRDW